MTSGAVGRVIEGVSLVRRLAIPAAVALVFGLASRASAQMPVLAPVEPEPPPPPAALSSPAAAPVPSVPAPAKTDHLLAAGPPVAPAVDDDGDEAYVDTGPRRRWYGWQTLTADGASLTLIVAGAGVQGELAEGSGEALVAMGLIGYGFAPGIIHFAHGNTGRGFASFGMRLGMPLAGAFLGAAAASGCDGFECEAGGAGLGLLFGMAGAVAIDAAVFAFDDAERSSEARLMPLVALAPRSAWLGLGGRL